MKFAIPEISWHNRDPVLSVDFQPKTSGANDPLRLASGGTDSHVLIWYVKTDNGSVDLEVAADLARHQKAVNVVRWSPSGEMLASGDDESIIFVWKQKTEDVQPGTLEEEQYKETWIIHKTLRGHMEDVLDLSWSATSQFLASGSVDNKLLIWDVARGKYSTILTDHKGFVQGVAWDPKGQYIASTSSDRVFRTFDVTTKKVVSRSSKAILPFPADHPFHGIKLRLYHDDTLQTYYRRLQFSPDGMFVAVPAGRLEPEQGRVDVKPINAVYIYTRFNFKVPVATLPCSAPALSVRWAPQPLSPRASAPAAALPQPARALLAVATKTSILLYDTHQKTPIALVSNVHYTRLTDLTWSRDCRVLVASSTDGYCSVVTFSHNELGEPYEETQQQTNNTDEPMEVQEERNNTPTDPNKDTPEVKKQEKPSNNTPKIDSYMKFKTPTDKSPKKRKITNVRDKTPVKIDLIEETAMQSWSDNSNNEIIKPKASESDNSQNNESEIMVIDDSEDIQLVYDETQSQSPKDPIQETEKPITDKEAPRRSPRKKSTSSPDLKTSPISSKSSSDFLKQAKVTDFKDPVVVKTVQSPKAPRRVSFVTLSSPKNSKKK